MARARATGARRARPRSKTPSAIRALTLLSLVFVVSAISAIAWLLLVYPKRQKEGTGREIAITIAPSTSVDAIAARLDREDVIESPFVFGVYLRMLGAHMRAGPIVLTDRMAPGDVAKRIAVGLGASVVRVTIPEGFTRFDIATRLQRYGIADRDAVLAAIDRPFATTHFAADSAEGYLFPDTYELVVGTDAAEVIAKLVENYERRVRPVFDEHAPAVAELERDLGMTRHDALILASIVEKEAVMRDERPVIARVFLNRLRSDTFLPRHRLQADPTVSYGCLLMPSVSAPCRAFDGRHITRGMLEDGRNPYNTYRIEGLPPGPVSNPGLSSIRAVLGPPAHDYLYFVARGGGRHAFSATLEAHNRAVARYRNGGR